MKLKIIIASTRPGRKGPILAEWFEGYARENSEFDIDILDLKEIDLPLFNEANHPMMANYEQKHTKNWSRMIDEADAFVVVTPEYNGGAPATIKNAMDYLNKEWQGKVMGFLSHGGVSAGTRAVQSLKLPATTLGMMPIAQAVHVPFYWEFISEKGAFEPNEITEKAADSMLNKLFQWAEALKGMREKAFVQA